MSFGVGGEALRSLFAPVMGATLVFAAVGLTFCGRGLDLKASGDSSRDLFRSAPALPGEATCGSTAGLEGDLGMGREPGKVPLCRMASRRPPGRAGACARFSKSTAVAAADSGWGGERMALMCGAGDEESDEELLPWECPRGPGVQLSFTIDPPGDGVFSEDAFAAGFAGL